MENLPIWVRRQEEWLSDRTRRERLALVIASAIGITVVVTDLLPTKISALGIEFSVGNQTAMLKLLAAVIAYLLVSFCIHAFADYVAWKTAFQTELREVRRKHLHKQRKPDEESPEASEALVLAHVRTPMPKGSLLAVRARDAIDVWFPTLLALFAVTLILRKAISL